LEPSPALVEASGKCAECHRRETSAIVVEYERSRHAQRGINCLDCHHPVNGQTALDHNGFVIAKSLTAANCAQCHMTEYDQFARSRHVAPAWASVNGPKDFSAEQLALGERYHPTWVNRKAMAIGTIEGLAAIVGGCNSCHSIGRPNADGSFGSGTNCHARHAASVERAREPSTCGQCHMGRTTRRSRSTRNRSTGPSSPRSANT
jgi:hydroxylamine dehydrogenase